ncbi:MAG: TraB/GumN family protein, partial [Steroidobacteraceae bacterium]|nr:TraB/GumN family protein [Steroidobacteraceae bacterium]
MARRLTCALALLLAGAANAGGGVFVLEDADNRVYIAGSIHMLKPEDAALSPPVLAAYADAERLVFELDLDDIDQAALAQQMLGRGMRSDGGTLSASLPQRTRAQLATEAARLGLPLQFLDSMEPWLGALVLTSVDLVRRGYRPESGVDQQLAERARADRKPVTGLETPSEQFDVFAQLTPAQQLKFLQMTLDELERAEEEIAKLQAAWKSGDLRRLEAELTDSFRDFPELEAALLTSRNRRWVPQLRALLAADDDVLVVVGAAHLVGPHGLL